MSESASTFRAARPSLVLALVAIASFVALAGISMPSAAAEPAREPRLEDFAEAIRLAPRAARAVHTALIPIEVHRGVTRSDLGDLRVFDAGGRLVPHAIRTLDAPEDRASSEVDLRFFPIEAPAKTTGDLGALTLQVVRDERGTVVDVRARALAEGASSPAHDGSAPSEAARIGACILDTEGLERPLESLRIELGPSEGDYMIPVSVETSDDLTRFTSLEAPQSLVRLTYAGEQIAQDRIELPAVEARYVVLRWKTGSLPAPIVRVKGELQTERASAERVVHRIPGRPHADDPQRIDFDLGGFVPVDRVRVVLAEDNALVAAELLAGPDAGGALDPVARATVYRVATGGQTLESPAIPIARRADRHWAVRAQAKGGGFGAALPELEIAYYPQQLIFLARGEAPFELAFGRYDAEPATFAFEELLGFLPEAERSSLPRSDVDASPPRILAGEGARTPPPPPLPIRRYVLWAVLVLGVAGLGLAAWRLVREVREPG